MEGMVAVGRAWRLYGGYGGYREGMVAIGRVWWL